MHVRFVVQARYQSTRLPGKVLADIGGKPLILHIYDRLKRIKLPDASIVFAVAEEDDSTLLQFMRDNDLPHIVGDERDVLMRFIAAAMGLQENDYVIRLTGDNPFVDHRALAALVGMIADHPHQLPDLAYAAGLPLGMAGEAIRVGALREQAQQQLQPHHTEHVSTYIKEHPEHFHISHLQLSEQSLPIRLTVDEAADLEMVRQLYDYFATKKKSFFVSRDVYDLYATDPSFFDTNANVEQKSATSSQTADEQDG